MPKALEAKLQAERRTWRRQRTRQRRRENTRAFYAALSPNTTFDPAWGMLAFSQSRQPIGDYSWLSKPRPSLAELIENGLKREGLR